MTNITKKTLSACPPPKASNSKCFEALKGFTLAEVLITLAIIGIIAALTVPTLMQKYQNHVIYTRLQKYYSLLSNAIKIIEKDNGNISEWGLKDFDTKSTLVLANHLKPYLPYTKMCEDTEGCWTEKLTTKINGDTYVNSFKTGLGGNIVVFKLQDDTRISIDLGVMNDINTMGAAIWIDINGNKPPNRFGRDVFCFQYYEKGLIPRGINDYSECTSNSTGGHTCAGRVLTEHGIKY